LHVSSINSLNFKPSTFRPKIIERSQDAKMPTQHPSINFPKFALISSPMHLLTIDYEEWFHIFDSVPTLDKRNWDSLPAMLPEITDKLLQTLYNHQTKATFFCMGWIANKYPDLIRKIQKEGHQIAAHSYWHQQVHKQTLQNFTEDLKANIITLEQITGQKITTYRAPAFTLFPVAGHGQEQLLKLGIEIDSSVLSGIRYNNKLIPNYPFSLQPQGLSYYPISAFKFINLHLPYAGSGYFRLLPEAFIHYQLSKGNYHMLYFHPRDLDPLMKNRKEFSLTQKLRFVTNTTNSLSKLERLLAKHPMTTINHAQTQIIKHPLPLL